MQQRCLQAPAGLAATAAARYCDALPRLDTERLVLRPPQIDDFPLWLKLMTGPDAPRLGGPVTPEAAWEAFCVYTAGWLLHGHGIWAVENRTDAALIGFVLIGLEWTDDEPELGWMLSQEARDHGYATEAAFAARDAALALLGNGRFVSYIEGTNDASTRVATRIGAQRDFSTENTIGDGTQVWRHSRGLT